MQLRRQILQLLRNRPVVGEIIDIQLKDIPVGILVINRGLDKLIRGPKQRDAEFLEADVSAQEIVECLVFESDVLHPRMVGLSASTERPGVSKKERR